MKLGGEALLNAKYDVNITQIGTWNFLDSRGSLHNWVKLNSLDVCGFDYSPFPPDGTLFSAKLRLCSMGGITGKNHVISLQQRFTVGYGCEAGKAE
ncbi:9717_t:CDS:2 [Acaulospora morrowiae]|uniref:9717_t:CDS:1 n=1 Tax=Acaulospora morrowiae TaxID=94023 RepID=A0A9N9F2E8_9GLOM|nr:9717_t:CDS:2 [Acaulospora morrowiae]